MRRAMKAAQLELAPRRWAVDIRARLWISALLPVYFLRDCMLIDGQSTIIPNTSYASNEALQILEILRKL